MDATDRLRSDPLPDALLWSEGMLLAPQHMQQNDIYWQRQLLHQRMLPGPHYWGIVDVVFDKDKLAAGTVAIQSAHAVMPDGLVVQYRGEGPPLAVDVSKIKEWRDGPLRVSLCVPRRGEGAASTASRIQRYDALPGALELDENTGDGGIEVERLRPRLELIAGLVPARYTHIALLELERTPTGGFAVTDYQPPVIRLDARVFTGRERLYAELDALAGVMRSKIRELMGSRRVDEAISRLDSELRQQLFVARQLAAPLPAFEVLLRSGVAHPYDLYLALAAIVGALAAVGTNASPPLLPAYDHDHARPGFQQALAFIRERLDLIAPLFESMFFTRLTPSTFQRVLDAEARTDRVLVELRPFESQKPRDLEAWMANARIACADLMDLLDHRRLLGAARRVVDARDVDGLNVPEDALLFELVQEIVEVNGMDEGVIRAGAALVIQGPAGQRGPHQIVLHRDRRPAEAPARRELASHG